MTQQNGSVFKGVWDANIIVGSGRVTIQVGDKNKRDGLPKEVRDCGVIDAFVFCCVVVLLCCCIDCVM